MDKISPIEPQAVKHIALPVSMPAKLVLCVYIDKDGKLWPATGYTLVKNLDAEDMETMGIDVSWQYADGRPFPRSEVDALIAKRKADASTGIKCVPTGTV